MTGLTRAQAATGHRVSVLTTDTLDASRRLALPYERLDGVAVTRVRNRSNAVRARLDLSTPVALRATARRLLREEGIELVHCHELRTVENLQVIGLAAGRGVPVALSPHGTLSYRTGRGLAKRAWDRLFGRWLRRGVDQVIALTETEATEARAWWGGGDGARRGPGITVVPNGVDPDEFARLPSGAAFRRRWGLGAGPVVLFVGRLAARKGLDVLVPAFAAAVPQVPDARLVLVGPDDGALGRVRALVADHRLAGRVTLTGLLTGTDRTAALAAADVFVLPAVGEGFSVAALEAMACGLPVVLTPGCHFPEAAAAGAGLVVPAEAGPLGAALAALLADAEGRARMGARARALVRCRYTWTRIAATLTAAYADVLRRRAP